jgi:hypothetical protein
VRAGAGNGGEVRGSRRMARDAVARVEEGSKEGNRAGIGERKMRGRRRSRRWSGGGRAAASGGLCAGSRRNGARQHVPEEEEERAARAW